VSAGKTTEDTDADSLGVVALRGAPRGHAHALDRAVTIIGRAPDADLQFDDPQLSRHHAELRRMGGGRFLLRDLDSQNGTFLNDVPAASDSQVELGDRIRLGKKLVLQIVIYDPVDQQLLQRQRLEVLGRLGAGIAHDFNNMLGTVAANLEFLSSQADDQRLGDPTTRECLDDLRAATDRAAALSRQLLRFTRNDPSKKATIEVTEVCHEVTAIVRRTFNKSIELVAEVSDGLQVTGTSLELHQVLMNLCLNARDAMPDGGTLTLRAALVGGSAPNRGQSGETVSIIVADTGVGIAESMVQQVFEPFVTTKRDGAGYGLGLSTVQEIVTNLSGSITIDSELGTGTTFTILLPAAAPMVRKRNYQTIDQGRLGPKPSATDPLRVLLVDDEHLVRRSTARVLSRRGHDVVTTDGGEEALREYLEQRPDIVMLDVDMPKWSGKVTLEALLKLDPNAAVIMVTGHDDPGQERSLRELGARGVVHKPWDLDTLTKAMELAIGR